MSRFWLLGVSPLCICGGIPVKEKKIKCLVLRWVSGLTYTVCLGKPKTTVSLLDNVISDRKSLH